MASIFSNNIAMDNFCYELVGEWVEYQKRKGRPFTSDDFDVMMENFMTSMEYAYEDYIADERF